MKNLFLAPDAAFPAAGASPTTTAGRAGATVQETAGSHAVYISKPEIVAALIKTAAREAGSRKPGSR